MSLQLKGQRATSRDGQRRFQCTADRRHGRVGGCRSGSNVSLAPAALQLDAFCKGSKLHRRHGASSARRVLARDLGRVRCFPILFGIPESARA
jgi:hypothetical protein